MNEILHGMNRPATPNAESLPPLLNVGGRVTVLARGDGVIRGRTVDPWRGIRYEVLLDDGERVSVFGHQVFPAPVPTTTAPEPNRSYPAAWHEARRLGVGGSDAGRILSGDWLGLWREKTGRTPPEDLSANLAVAMGTFTEPLNRYWFTQQTGVAVTPVSEARVHPQHPYMRANLDGLCGDGAVFEAKHVNAFARDDEVLARYFPQLQHYLAVTGAHLARLSVFFGSNKWASFEVARDERAIQDLILREARFWDYVARDEAPPNQGSASFRVEIGPRRVADMTGCNAWAGFAFDWLEHRDAAGKFDTAAKGLKTLVEPDVKQASGYGVLASRSKSGSISLKPASRQRSSASVAACF
ncbi:MAG: YqaJ viral recombinase family protein [Alphaproteobacteria bacterium]|nr:YqaJ viral recombinase family protein [Alphaproteobacteria bacterium]